MKYIGTIYKTFALVIIILAVILGINASEKQAVAKGSPELILSEIDEPLPGKTALEDYLPLPGSLPLDEYEKILYPFIRSRKYATELNWVMDKGVRDTGPWIKNHYYGTHTAVRIFYSPSFMYWLTGNPDYWPEGKKSGVAITKKPRAGSVPDGAMIIKEMFSPPAAQYKNWPDSQLVKTLYTDESPGWTLMVRDSAGSKDGWFWSSVYYGEKPDAAGYPYPFPNSGFGQPCLRCHATAEKDFTFSSTTNIKGFAGDPITFFVDDTWRKLKHGEYPFIYEHDPTKAPPPPPLPTVETNEEFLKVFHTEEPVPYHAVHKFPSEDFDHVVAGPNGAEKFLTSDQCMMCHSGGASNYGGYGPIMFIETGPNAGDGLNISPYGEWRWSPMGLAGRDPVFHAQIESELSILKGEMSDSTAKFFGNQTVNTCLLCHGVMGKRQFDIQQGVGNKYWADTANFDLSWFYLKGPDNKIDPVHAKFGGLARDGISCMSCHHVEQDHKDIKSFLQNNTTGLFKAGPASELYGPFEDSTIVTYPMENLLSIKPKFDPYIKSSRMCGTCHTIDLPVVDYPLDNPPVLTYKVHPDSELNKADKNPNFKNFMHSIEQATYLEWLNSKFQDEFAPFDSAKQSCQDCHMPANYVSNDGKINISPIKTKIAFVEDQSYPQADHRMDLDSITTTFRDAGYKRHQLQGLNIFLAEIFKQFNDVLGVRLKDYETGTLGLDFAIDNFVQQARDKTAAIDVLNFKTSGDELNADVKVTNKTGHRFPSGVGFRRAFIEFLVIDNTDGRDEVIWASGRTNGVGVIVDGDGNILPSEFLTKYVKDGDTLQYYQPHWQVIDSEDKVQIYEELTMNAKEEFTTSFMHRDIDIKENRILPAGWSKKGPSPEIPKAFIEATYPGPGADKDPDYLNGSGTDIVHYKVKLPRKVNPKNLSVVATLYYQEWAPYFLMQRFTNIPPGPEGDARRRLYYLTSNLKVEGTPIEDWKLKLVSAKASQGQ